MAYKKTKKYIKDEWFDKIIEVFEVKKLNPNITNEDCANELNEMFDCNFSESAWRKKYQTGMKFYNRAIEEIGNGVVSEEDMDRRVKTIAKAQSKIMFERKVTQEMRKEIFPAMRKAAKFSLIDRALLSVSDYEYNEIKFTTIKRESTSDIPVYGISDLHYGLIIDVKGNKFDLDVANSRMKQISDYIVKDIKKNKYDEFIIFDGGDIIEGSGNLRASQWLSTILTMTQQITMSADFMTSFYLHLSNELSKMKRDIKGHIYMVTSANHTQLRISGTKRDEVENDDVSLIIADIIKKNIGYVGESVFTTRNENANGKFDSEITKDDYNLNFDYADEHIIDINGVKTFLTHGHQYKFASNLHNVISNRENVIIDVVMTGHWHSYAEDTVGSRGKFTKKKITLPSICGDTGYAHRLGYSSQPGGMKFVFNNKYGLVGSNFIPVD